MKLKKVINEAGKQTISEFVKENLNGNVGEGTIDSYVAMAQSRMEIHGGMPSLEISMCFSLTGENEEIELDETEVTYETAECQSVAELGDVFSLGDADAAALSAGKAVKSVYDGYVFTVTPESGRFLVTCDGPVEQ